MKKPNATMDPMNENQVKRFRTHPLEVTRDQSSAEVSPEGQLLGCGHNKNSAGKPENDPDRGHDDRSLSQNPPGSSPALVSWLQQPDSDPHQSSDQTQGQIDGIRRDSL